MKNELEAKFLKVNKDEVREKLKAGDYELVIPEYLMRRKNFDFSGIAPGKNKWGRVRQEADKITMTVKEVRGEGINDTFEAEVIVADFDDASAVFEACGIRNKAFQESKREVWKKDNVEVTLDTWPGLEPFIEIEAQTEEEIKTVAESLGYDLSNAMYGSIDMVYEKELGIPASKIIVLPEITFEKIPQ